MLRCTHFGPIPTDGIASHDLLELIYKYMQKDVKDWNFQRVALFKTGNPI